MESKKRKIAFGVAIGVGGIVMLLAMVYSYLAFMPTGYGKFESAAGTAQERVTRMAQPRVDFHESMATSTQSRIETRGAAPVATPLSEVDFIKAVADFNSVEALRQDDSVRVLLHVNQQPVAFGVNWLKPNEPEPGRPIWSSLEPDHCAYMIRYIPSIFHEGEKTAATAGQIKKFLGRLDEVEDFLLRRKWTISPQSEFYQHEYHELFSRLALYAIARASLNHDQDRAMKILARFLEAERIVRVHDHDRGDGWNDSDDIAVVLFGLAELPDFPAQGWDRARAELERMRMSEAELADLRRARASLYHNIMVERIKRQSLGHMENFWHFFYDGKVESAANKAIEPIMLRRLEGLSMAMGGDDYVEFDRMREQFHATMKYINVGGLNREDAPEFYRVEHQFNDKVDRSLLLLEAARARRDGKTIEAPIAIGTPARLHMETITVPRSGIFTLGPDLSPAQLSRFYSTIRQFEIAHPGRGVVWAEDVEAVLKSLGPGEWGKYVRWQDPRPAYVIWSVGHYENQYIYRRDPAIPLHRQTMAIKLQVVAVDFPLISEEMKKVLSNE